MIRLSHKEFALLKEILRDAEACARLSQWEEEFLDDMRGRVLVQGADLALSDKQWQVLHRIEAKVYA